ncbi:MAG TPA: superoxide dismutase [Fermentimonas sp.]|nr:superoxide dismutase [Fermentimonas sp.]
MRAFQSYLISGILAMALVSCNNSKAQNSENNSKNSTNMKFEKVALPYETDALEPVISKQTVELHYGKHHQAYVDNLNKLVVGTKFENADLETVVKESDGAIFNNAGQILNHNIYFPSFKKDGGGEPKGKLAEAINSQFGSFEKFKEEFNAAGVGVFGSGWVWLAKDSNGTLSINKESNAGNPITKGLTPILGFDVWEHSYYLDYQNRRAEHLSELWKIIDWDVVSARY